MKKKYLRPWLRVVEINGDDIVCTSGEEVKSMRVELNDYDTFENKPRTSGVDWNGEGTGSDF